MVKFEDIINDIITYNLSIFATNDILKLDFFIDFFINHIPNTKRYNIQTVDDFKSVISDINDNDSIAIIEMYHLPYNKIRKIRKIRNNDKTIIIFYHIYDTYNLNNTIPKYLLYESDVAYLLTDELKCLKNRHGESDIKIDIEKLMRYYKIKKLLKNGLG